MNKNPDVLAFMREHVLGFFNRKQQLVLSPADGLMLRLHYKQTFWLFLTGFFMVYFNWFTTDIITCVSHFNTELQQRSEHLNLCLSYPFIELDNKRVTLLYYRWMHWILLLCALMFIVPHKISKIPKYDKITRLVEFFSNSLPDYGNKEPQIQNSMCRFFAIEKNGMNKIFYRYFFANIAALLTSAGVFTCLDAVLNGYFFNLGVDAFPITLTREADSLSDPLTRAFPPFVNCQINKIMALTNKREEQFGCHLTAQEYYEKLFLIIWYWLVFLISTQALYLIFLTCFFSKLFCKKMIRFLLKRKIHEEILAKSTEKFEVGDWFLLYKMRSCFLYDGLDTLIEKMSDGVTMEKFIEHSKRQLNQIKDIMLPALERVIVK